MPMAKIRRLGTSSDSKNYIYNHQAPNSASTLQPPSLNPTTQPSSYSLINATKLPYNPINHSTTYSQPKVPLPHYHSGTIRINWDRCPRRRIWGDWMHLIIPRSLRRSWPIMPNPFFLFPSFSSPSISSNSPQMDQKMNTLKSVRSRPELTGEQTYTDPRLMQAIREDLVRISTTKNTNENMS